MKLILLVLVAITFSHCTPADEKSTLTYKAGFKTIHI